jgi:hypothetical protein
VRQSKRESEVRGGAARRAGREARRRERERISDMIDGEGAGWDVKFVPRHDGTQLNVSAIDSWK